jgi:hypothetical protein
VNRWMPATVVNAGQFKAGHLLKRNSARALLWRQGYLQEIVRLESLAERRIAYFAAE